MIPDVGLFAFYTASPLSTLIGLLVGAIVPVMLFVVPLWLLCKNLKINPYLSLLIFVPIANLFIFWILYLIIDQRRS